VARPFPPMWRPLRPPWGEKVRLTQRVEIDVRRRASDNCGFAGSAPGLRALRSDPTGRAVTGSCWRTPLARRPVRQSHVRYPKSRRLPGQAAEEEGGVARPFPPDVAAFAAALGGEGAADAEGGDRRPAPGIG
jgi:hypothetical protein